MSPTTTPAVLLPRTESVVRSKLCEWEGEQGESAGGPTDEHVLPSSQKVYQAALVASIGAARVCNGRQETGPDGEGRRARRGIWITSILER